MFATFRNKNSFLFCPVFIRKDRVELCKFCGQTDSLKKSYKKQSLVTVFVIVFNVSRIIQITNQRLIPKFSWGSRKYQQCIWNILRMQGALEAFDPLIGYLKHRTAVQNTIQNFSRKLKFCNQMRFKNLVTKNHQFHNIRQISDRNKNPNKITYYIQLNTMYS